MQRHTHDPHVDIHQHVHRVGVAHDQAGPHRVDPLLRHHLQLLLDVQEVPHVRRQHGGSGLPWPHPARHLHVGESVGLVQRGPRDRIATSVQPQEGSSPVKAVLLALLHLPRHVVEGAGHQDLALTISRALRHNREPCHG
eukprot:3229613-Pyramimonas_sp.AAC.1